MWGSGAETEHFIRYQIMPLPMMKEDRAKTDCLCLVWSTNGISVKHTQTPTHLQTQSDSRNTVGLNGSFDAFLTVGMKLNDKLLNAIDRVVDDSMHMFLFICLSFCIKYLYLAVIHFYFSFSKIHLNPNTVLLWYINLPPHFKSNGKKTIDDLSPCHTCFLFW